MSHINIEIFNLTRELLSEVHALTLQLSKLQVFENVRPITRSIYSATSNFTEAHKMPQFSYELIKHLVNMHTPGHGTNHLEALFEKGALTNENLCAALKARLEMLGGALNGFRQSAGVLPPEQSV